MLLLDINVWIAMAFDGHVHHPVARKWFDGLSDNDFCIFCRLTQQGFLRLASSPQIFGSNALTLVDAWQKYDAFLSDPRVSFMVEPVGIEQQWRDLTRAATFSTKVWSDDGWRHSPWLRTLRSSPSTKHLSNTRVCATRLCRDAAARPHPQKETDKGGVRAMRRLLNEAGVTP
jgi:toxin-antitoxin system PIN domain toxin